MSGADSNETLRERWDESRLKLWILLDGNRLLVAGGMTVAVFLLLLVLGVVDPSLRSLIRGSDEIKTTAQAYITALITGVTLVITINQLVISRELGTLGEQRDRMTGVMKFRGDIEDLLESSSPTQPAKFLGVLLDLTMRKSQALTEAVADNDTDELRRKVEEFDESIAEHGTQVSRRLERAGFDQFEVVRMAMDYNYSWKVHEIRRVRREYWDDLRSEERQAFNEMVEVLELFAPARENFKTLYFRLSLLRLSRHILYGAVPAVVLATAVSLYLDAADFPGAFLGVDNLVWIVSATVAIWLLPFLLLTSYVFRIAVIAERTLTIGPFVLRESERTEDVSWEDEKRATADIDERPADVPDEE